MNFIDYPIALDEEISSPDILRTRREQLNLSQQQVATAANLQLRQYQRFENGERYIEAATMKTGLSVCAVLKLNPFVFFPETDDMNRYSDHTPKSNDYMQKEKAIPLLLQKACEMFNERCHTNYSLDNIKIAYCTIDNIVETYKTFTKQYGFHSEIRKRSDFESVLAEAFIGQTDIDDPDHVDGILVRTDPPTDLNDPESYLILLVHELSHIFCITHEIDSASKAGQRFFELYCADIPGTPAQDYNNGYMNAGYTIWRDFIAEIMQDIVYQQPSKHLGVIYPILQLLADEVKIGNPASKSAFHRYLSEIINTWEGSEAETFDDLKPLLEKLNLPFIRIVEYVFNNLHGKDCYKITPSFIEGLGAMYLSDMIRNTPMEDMMKFAQAYGIDNI